MLVDMKPVVLIASAAIVGIFALEFLPRLYARYIPFELIRNFEPGLRQKIAILRNPLGGVDDRVIDQGELLQATALDQGLTNSACSTRSWPNSFVLPGRFLVR